MRRLALLALALPLAACPGDDDTDEVVDTDTTNESDVSEGSALLGTWQADGEGTVFGSGVLGEVGYLVFAPADGGDGSTGFLSFFGDLGASKVLACEDVLYATQEGGGLLLSNPDVFYGSALVLAEVEGDVLTITSMGSSTAYSVAAEVNVETFHRVDDVPAAARCGTATAAASHAFDLQRNSFGNVIFDGTSVLLPTDSDGVVAVDVDAGTAGPAVSYGTQWDQLITAQGADAWGHCGCGGSEEVGRTSVGGTQVDLVESGDLGVEMSIRYGAWDGVYLWLGGHARDDGRALMLEVDTEAEPDELVAEHPMLFEPEAVVMHQGVMHALVNRSVVTFDPATGTATGTWKLPPTEGYWFGLTSDGDDLYAAATVYADQERTEIVRLDPLE